MNSSEEVTSLLLCESLFSRSLAEPKTAEEKNLSKESVNGLHGRGVNVNLMNNFAFDIEKGTKEEFLKLNETDSSDVFMKVLSVFVNQKESIVVSTIHGGTVELKSFPDFISYCANFNVVSDLPLLHIYNKSGNENRSEAGIVLQCPDCCPVRKRMIHSSCLSSLPTIIKQFGLEIIRTSVVQSSDEIEEQMLEKEKRIESDVIEKPKFSKPLKKGRLSSRKCKT